MPANLSFPSELRTLAFVPRWSIVATSRTDDVASHSYYVTLYAYIVARLIRWEGPKEYLMLSALLHDLDEVFSGDIVGPVKSKMVDRERADEFLNEMMFAKFGSLVDDLIFQEERLKVKQFEEAQAIIKVGDRLDALFFLIWERRMGNLLIEKLEVRARNLLEASWRALPADAAVLSRLWQTEVLPSIRDNENEGGRGI